MSQLGNIWNPKICEKNVPNCLEPPPMTKTTVFNHPMCIYIYIVTNQPEVMEVKSWFPIPKYPLNKIRSPTEGFQKEIRR